MSSTDGSSIVPCLRYRDALAAIDWLCRAFGFEKHAVYADGDTVLHAQLVFGNGMVMLGSADNAGEWGRHMAQPDEIGMRETQSACVVVADVDAHYAQAIPSVNGSIPLLGAVSWSTRNGLALFCRG